MERRSHHTLLVSLLVSLLICACGSKVEVQEYSIVPEPALKVMKPGTFTLDTRTKLCCVNIGQNSETVRTISKTLRKIHFHPSFVGTPTDNCINVVLNDTLNPSIGEEGYLLEVRSNGIFLTANTETGLFYAFQTLLQMVPADIAKARYSKVVLPLCTIKDTPRFAWRGCMLDCSRHFFSTKDIKRHIDLMANYKLNRFVWHLADDHGWRIESESYPTLCDVGAWRVDRSHVDWEDAQPARQGELANYGGYYSREEIRDIVEYALQRHIDIIPSIPLPDHCSALLAAYPQLACTGADSAWHVQVGPYWPSQALVCAGSDSVLTLLYTLLDELIELFPSQYIHLGFGDVDKEPWQNCSRCAHRMQQLRLDNTDQLETWFMRQLCNHLAEHGRHLMGWDELLSLNAPTDAAVVVRGDKSTALRASLLQHPTIVAPTELCNLDFPQGNPTYQPHALPKQLTLRDVYQFDPTAHSLRMSASYIEGGMALLWTEYIRTAEEAQYMLLPRLCAMAECLWSDPSRRNWHSFRHRLVYHKQQLSSRGFRCAEGSLAPILQSTHVGANQFQVTIESEVEGAQLYVYREGMDDGALYTEPFTVPHGTHIWVQAYLDGKAQEEPYEYIIGEASARAFH